MQITRSTIDTMHGPSDWFTGSVWVDAVAMPSDASRLGREQRPFHPGRTHRLAHAPARSDDLRARGRRPHATAGRAGGGDPAG